MGLGLNVWVWRGEVCGGLRDVDGGVDGGVGGRGMEVLVEEGWRCGWKRDGGVGGGRVV